ncbi:MAG: helix-turn-helix domain-containing protein [Gammaproteobacteria bacterium]
MPNPLLLFAAQIVAILSVLLLAAGYLKTEPKATSARVFAVMAVFIVFYLVIGMSGPNIDPQFRVDLTGWRLLLLFGINAICGLFMIYCFLIFQEQSSFPKPLAAAFGMQVVIDLILSYLAVDSTAQEPAAAAVFLSFSMDVLQLVFVCLAIFWTLKGWRTDLVEDRRVFRWFIIGLQGALIFSVVFVENFLLAGGSASYASEQAVIVYAIAVLTLGMLLAALRFDFVSLSYVIRRVTELTEEKSGQGTEAIDEESFNRVFRDGLLYREAGLTISGLAKKLNMPEYRLRAFIHKQLGFRNFNAMLHKYRIEDASAALADSSKQNLPVLTIALSVGYQSITPFNNAFREIKGVTPSEYRKKMQD